MSKSVRPSISDWNRFEEWANGVGELSRFLGSAGIKPDDPYNVDDFVTTATDWNL